MSKIEIINSYKQAFLEKDLETFEQIMALSGGEVFKANQHRSVVRFKLWYEDKETDFFCKRHLKPENKDKWRDFFSFHWPLSDGLQEFQNIEKVNALGIPTMKPVAWGEEEGLSFNRKSFLVTESLGNLERLEDYLIRKFAGSLTKESVDQKRKLIQKIAQLAARLHSAHFCHRDFYCGHWLVKEEGEKLPTLHLIDLQRVRKHRYLRRRWKTKDLAALNFTAAKEAISSTDRFRFFFYYLNILKLGADEKQWIRKILNRTLKIDRHTKKKRRKYLNQKS